MNKPNEFTKTTLKDKVAPPPSFVKLAMKNMVRKGGQSINHLGLTALFFFGFVLLLASLVRPNIPN